ncbi:Protein kinase-like [Venustampulla echinocandica]|uniref:EKC/KEOPS complex subunit BUD32 n=1 Tax=Venustampulla echinocandica TaxID=2656787 RepID=A0A370TET7_9HELO|nr:Protein kinase-like [Venustampulla echinocandica]RDL33191.1 Protein kinase-like [Venustampulla echinocandica]
MENIGSTSTIELVRPGVVLKQPIIFKTKGLADKVDLCFSVEPLILEKLGHHPRIVEYLGKQGRGLLLGQASHSNLQVYIDNHPSTDLRQRKIWCRQLTEALAYIHSHGVVHSDLRPKNILVHETSPGSRDLVLCDFGGSTCDELGLDGGCLPDGPFYSPTFGVQSTPALDIFGLGSLFYTILTGYWPYRSCPGPPETIDEKMDYEKEVAQAFHQGKYPDVTQVVGGSVILGCWMKQYLSAEEVLLGLDREMPISEDAADIKYAGHISMFLLVAISVTVLIASTYIIIRRLPR